MWARINLKKIVILGGCVLIFSPFFVWAATDSANLQVDVWAGPAAPTNFLGTAVSTNQINWTWIDNANNETAYEVYDNLGILVSPILPPDTTSWPESPLLANTSYTRYARASNFAGGSNSNTDSCYTWSSSPVGASATGISTSAIVVSWLSGGAQSKFNVYRNGISGVGTLVYSAASTSFTNFGLSPNTSYSYYIYSVNGDNIENPSYASANTSTQSLPPSLPPSQPSPTKDTTSPVAKILAPERAIVEEKVEFDGSESSDNGGIVSYEWEFGDGNGSSGAKVNHTYYEINRFLVKLTVKDNVGNYSQATHFIEITPPAPKIKSVETNGNDIIVKGEAYPEIMVYVYLKSKVYEGRSQVDKKGDWQYTFKDADDFLLAGEHTIYALANKELENGDQIRGPQSKVYDFEISFDKEGKLVLERKIKLLHWIIGGLVFVILAGVIFFLFWRRRKKRFDRES